MVRFQVRWTKKLYKGKEHRYKHFNMDFPADLNPDIDPHREKDFKIEGFVHTKKLKREFISITLARDLNKTEQQTPS